MIFPRKFRTRPEIGGKKGKAKVKRIDLAPFQQLQLEKTLLRGIKECNNGIKRCNAEGNIRGAEYIREVKRRPLIKKLQDVRKGIIWE
nr:MAG TPA: hypothetical protein [Caudoviricetes sp.]